MLKIGPLELGSVPRIAVPFDDRPGKRVVEAAARRGMDLAELRVDHFGAQDPQTLRDVVSRFGAIPRIGTIRLADEGGRWQGSERERLALFRELLPQVDAVDVELAAEALLPELRHACREQGRVLIVSHHDFAATPDRGALGQLVDRALEAGADLVKIATQPRTRADLHSLAALCIDRAADAPLIVIGMGEFGVSSRLWLPVLGSQIAFASLDDEHATAPGQLGLDRMRREFAELVPGYPAPGEGADPA